jgi:hypothetical protein
MLPLRFAVFAAVFGIALSGLFWLLGNLSEPQLLRSKQAVIVKGCDSLESEAAARRCPQLFCQKFLLERREFELRYRFEVTVDKRSGPEHLIGGIAQPFVARPGDGPVKAFACILDRGQVVAGSAVPTAELAALAEQDGWLETSAQILDSNHP